MLCTPNAPQTPPPQHNVRVVYGERKRERDGDTTRARAVTVVKHDFLNERSPSDTAQTGGEAC